MGSIPQPRLVLQYMKSCHKYAKISLYMLTKRLLAFSVLLLLVLSVLVHSLCKEGSILVNLISQVLKQVLHSSVDLVRIKQRKRSWNNLMEGGRLIQNVYIVQSARTTKKLMPNPQFPSEKASNTIVGFFSLPLNCPSHATGKLFHCQFWQYIELMDPEKHLVVFLSTILRIFASVGSIKCSLLNSFTKSSQKKHSWIGQ